MSIDASSDLHGGVGQSGVGQSGVRRSPERQNTAGSPWARRSLLLFGAMAIISPAAWMVQGVVTDTPDGPRMTYKVTRGNLVVSVTEQGTLESSENTEIKCRVRGQNTVTFVVESGTNVKKGDVLVKLDTLMIEEAIAERTKYAHWSRSAAERSKASVARAELAVSEYLEGRYVAELMTHEKDLAIAESNLRTARNKLSHAQEMAESGYVSPIQVEEREFAKRQAELNVAVKKTEIDVLQRYTKQEQLETLRGNLKAAQALHEANAERAYADAHRRDRALDELKQCEIRAQRDGLVIYPSAAAWKSAPDIEEGATVHQDQILLLMPDMKKMQVKVGIHESIIEQVGEGLRARVTLPDQILEAEVTSVASVTSPAGWWTGNVVKYDTIIQLPETDGLKPGMSAEVEVILAEYTDVLTVPVTAVVETAEGSFCWIQTADGSERRAVELGDSNDVFIIVKGGLEEGEEVVLNPLAFVEEAQTDVLKPAVDADAPGDSGDNSESGSVAPQPDLN